MKLQKYINEKIELTGEKNKDKWLKQLEGWKSDLRKMTKIYKSLKAEDTPKAIKAFNEARKLFNRFRDNWEKWHTQFTKKKYVPGAKNEESFYAEQVRINGWQAEMSITDLFPESYDYRIDKHVPSPWQLDKAGYRKGDTRKNKILVYQKAFKKAFSSVEDLMKYQFDLVTPDIIEKINVAGVNIIVTKDKDTGEFSRKNLKMFMNILPKAIQVIKKSGFTEPLKGLTVKLRLTERSSGDKGGEYLLSSDTIAIYKWGMADKGSALHTLVHELGHRYYRKSLNEKARTAWSNTIWKRFVTVEKNHVEEFFNKYIKNKFNQNNKEEYLIDKTDRSKVDILIKKNENDPTSKAIFLQLIHSILYSTSLDKLSDEIGERIHIEFITDYAKKNSEEAFCEAFAFWVLKRRKLGEWTRAFFKEIVRSGGANIKEGKEKLNLIDKYIGDE